MWIFVLWFIATAAILGSATGVITWTEDQNTLSVAKTTNIDSLVTGSQLNVRAQFNSSKEGVIKFLTEADLTAFYLAVATDGLTVTCGNDRTKFTKNLRSPLKEGESYEYQVDITNEGYSTTFQREKLPVTLYAKSDWQCMHVDTDFGGYDIHEGNSSGIADCYNRCLNMTNCEAFAIVYKGSISLKQVNWCWCKSRKYGRGATRLVNIKAANMDCFIDNTDVKKLQGSGAVFNELTLGILQGRNNVECDRLACDETNECEPDKLIKTQDQCCPVCNTTKNGTCVTVGGNTLCNVTVTWTPRVSETGAIFAMIVPVIFTVVMFVLFISFSIKRGLNSWTFIKDTYRRNTYLLYAKKHLGSAQYEKIKRELLVTGLKVKFLYKKETDYKDIEDNLLKEEIIILKKKESKEGIISIKEMEVTKGDVKESIKRRQILGCITLPLSCAHKLLISQIIILPIFKIFWDMLDVLFDTYYFYKLERGELIDPLIYRNIHVNNSILGFACLGAIKSVLVAVCYLGVVESNKNEREDHYKVVRYTLVAVSVKLLLEDAPELILEYFWVDKFIIDNPPWFLVAKDVVTALIYILPVIKIVKSGFKDFKLIKKKQGSLVAYLLYIPATLARGCISFTMIFRIVGMIIQYMGSTVNAECFVVFDNALQQTPFALGCLNWYDYTVLVFTCLTLLLSIPPVIFFIYILVKE